MGKSKKNRHNKNAQRLNKPTKKEKLNNKIEEEKQKVELLDWRRKNREKRLKSAHILLMAILRIVGIIVFCLFLLGIVVSIAFALYYLILEDNVIANKYLTSLQVLTGIVSLVIGIWALVLTIKASSNNKDTQVETNIIPQNANSKPKAHKENDIDYSTLS